VRLPLFLAAGAVIALCAWTGITASPSTPTDAALAVEIPLTDSQAGQLASGETGTVAVAAAAPGPVDPAGGQPGASTAVVPAPPPQAATPVAPTPLYSIAVAARGHQAELDACQWVRMDLGATAPIVGGHNFCHGDVVLAMAVGEVVTVTGTDLDGDYQVTGSRDARAGDIAAVATAGLAGDIIFQTCYWDDAQGLRLVTAVKVDLSLPPIVIG
jgi:hypothetical protein